MSKNSEIQQYLAGSRQNPENLLQLNQQDMVIFGDFSNLRIFTESKTKLPKEGILVLEENDLVFFGSKSLLEKEYLIFMPYANLKLASSPAFTINFTVTAPFEQSERCKFSIAWEDYISKNIKTVFLEKLSLLITDGLIKKASQLAAANRYDEEAYFYYNRVLAEKIYAADFLKAYINLVKTEAKIGSHGYSNLYLKFLTEKKSLLLSAYDFEPARELINHELADSRTNLLTETSMEFFHSYYHDFIYFDDDRKISVDEAARHPGIRKIIEEETTKEVATLREKLQNEFQEKADRLAEKLEIEKNIYREVIRDNIILGANLKIDPLVSEKLIDTVSSFYYRYKVLKDKFPDQFLIARSRPHEGLTHLRFIMENLTLGYLKICDPYLFATELDLFYDIPADIDLKILTFAVNQQADKLEKFKTRLTDLRKTRFGKVAVKLVFFKNRTNSPLHDRLIFSKDWGMSLSNSLSQIGAAHDVSCQRIYNSKEKEVALFDDYWFAHNEAVIQGKRMNIQIIDL